MDLREYSLEEKNDFYKKFNLFNIGRTHAKVRNVFNINNNKKPNPNKLLVLETYASIDKAFLNKIKFDYFVVCPELAVTSEACKVVEKLSEYVEGYAVSKKVYQGIVDKTNKFGILVVAFFPLVEFAKIKIKENMTVLVLDGLEVQGNIGTIIRTSDGANVDLVVLTNKRIRITHPKFVRSSMGTCLSVPLVIAEVDETIYWLKRNGFKMYLTDTDAIKNYFEVDYSNRTCIVAGSEKYGIMKTWYDYHEKELIKIPMLGKADSLNVGVATSIIVYESIRKKI